MGRKKITRRKVGKGKITRRKISRKMISKRRKTNYRRNRINNRITRKKSRKSTKHRLYKKGETKDKSLINLYKILKKLKKVNGLQRGGAPALPAAPAGESDEERTARLRAVAKERLAARARVDEARKYSTNKNAVAGDRKAISVAVDPVKNMGLIIDGLLKSIEDMKRKGMTLDAIYKYMLNVFLLSSELQQTFSKFLLYINSNNVQRKDTIETGKLTREHYKALNGDPGTPSSLQQVKKLFYDIRNFASKLIQGEAPDPQTSAAAVASAAESSAEAVVAGYEPETVDPEKNRIHWMKAIRNSTIAWDLGACDTTLKDLSDKCMVMLEVLQELHVEAEKAEKIASAKKGVGAARDRLFVDSDTGNPLALKDLLEGGRKKVFKAAPPGYEHYEDPSTGEHMFIKVKEIVDEDGNKVMVRDTDVDPKPIEYERVQEHEDSSVGMITLIKEGLIGDFKAGGGGYDEEDTLEGNWTRWMNLNRMPVKKPSSLMSSPLEYNQIDPKGPAAGAWDNTEGQNWAQRGGVKAKVLELVPKLNEQNKFNELAASVKLEIYQKLHYFIILLSGLKSVAERGALVVGSFETDLRERAQTPGTFRQSMKDTIRRTLNHGIREMEKAEERIHEYAEEGSLSKAMNLGLEEDEDAIARSERAKQVAARDKYWQERQAKEAAEAAAAAAAAAEDDDDDEEE
jgi:hypothetical protein